MRIGELQSRGNGESISSSLLENDLSFSGLNRPPGALSCRFAARVAKPSLNCQCCALGFEPQKLIS
jgi:hypothetical protein